ncbi:MAG TPA: hypothetical protein DEF43_00300 [Chloroflexus aurantiacus]|jgi:hypothetical protein|uniref:Uncharacterized protein n=1 Tax=Chloroflexus aurantiacus (strain ATCC 29366 / DSM 635 / J-10-fl) TaxID=324602 RepID=A9WFG1_CHLAA|nr:hypothetical protein [Chloroflexus aurantiacus]ABY33899.1 conserved hypothetical protein [Chloroflexus aurantiacus J-10-fl]RMG02634.1 MAG: hypothetical protein D6735_09965 [Acidobacteriota bacterium]GIV94947.1 MAG: hypothetical protein KatS3mg056_3656 [Chloroflexus sp.]HBW65617.1 hypothetical protein [Chloroflexus aurantiacus]
MTTVTLSGLQVRVQDKTAFQSLDEYYKLCYDFLSFVNRQQLTPIVSPNRHHYIFYQFDQFYGYRITRPINTNLFIEDANSFNEEFNQFLSFLDDVKSDRDDVIRRPYVSAYLQSRGVHKVIYTIQQSIGCVGDSFDNSNQSRKRVGQLFEIFIRLIIQRLGLDCDSRTITLPLPGYPDHEMSFELDLVFSKGSTLVVAETRTLHEKEIIASVKTTSKDRLDKIFLDKHLLSHILGRNVPVVAIFLHDVQRSRFGNSPFGISSTFKSNHFLGYTIALNGLDGVYYVDLPESVIGKQFYEQIKDLQTFLIRDIWVLTA